MRTLCLAVALVPSLALAQAEELQNPGSVLAVQERAYRMNHELSLGVGVLPLDAFYKGYFGHVAYTYHFSDAFAWQVARFSYSYNVDTGLKSQLLTQYGVLPTQFPEVQWIAGSDLVWSPLYGKWSFLNRSVVHFEGFLDLGASVLDLTNQAAGLPFKPAISVGLGARVFSSKHISFRLDVTDNVVFINPILNVPTIQLAASINIGATE